MITRRAAVSRSDRRTMKANFKGTGRLGLASTYISKEMYVLRQGPKHVPPPPFRLA